MKSTNSDGITHDTQQKIVIDTNVWISTFISHGVSYKVVDLCITTYKVYCCTFIIEEIKRNLLEKFKVSKDSVIRVCEFIYKHTSMVEYVKNEVPEICKDLDDNHILSCCEKCVADWLITGDNELLELKEYKKTKIICPREFLNLILKQKL